MKKILIIFFITIFSYSSWANFITSERSPEAICNDPSNPIVQAHVSSTNQEGGYITAEAIRAARQAVIDRCIYWVSKRREERRRVMENSCENFRTTYEGNCTTPRRTLWEGYRNLLAEAQDFQAQYLSDETEQSLEEAKDKPAGLNEAMAYYISEIGNFRAQRQNLKTLCDSLMDAREEICSVTDEVVVGEDVVTPESNTIASAELTQPVEDFVYVQKAEEITTQTFKQEERAQTTGGELENQSQTIIENFSRILGGGIENNDGCSSGGVGLAASCNTGGGGGGDDGDRGTARGSGDSPTTPSGDGGGIYAEIPRDGDGYGGNGNSDNDSNQNPHSPHGELSKTGGGGGSGFSFDPSALNTGIGSASANIGVNSRGSNYYSGNTFPTQNNSNSRSRYTTSYNSGSFNAQTGSNFGQGSSARNSQASKNQGDSASTGAGWAGHTGNMALNTGGNRNLNLGNDNNNSDYQKARTNQGSRGVAQRSGSKQIYSSKNDHNGHSSGIFSSSKDRNLRRGPASVKTGANAQSGSQFDPSKYEPSLAAQQRAMARATGRMISGQSRGHVVWPKDIHRHKKGSKTSVFNHIRVQYQKQLLD